MRIFKQKFPVDKEFVDVFPEMSKDPYRRFIKVYALESVHCFFINFIYVCKVQSYILLSRISLFHKFLCEESHWYVFGSLIRGFLHYLKILDQ